MQPVEREQHARFLQFLLYFIIAATASALGIVPGCALS